MRSAGSQPSPGGCAERPSRLRLEVRHRRLKLRIHRRGKRPLVRNRLTARVGDVREPGGIPGVAAIEVLPAIVVFLPGASSTKKSHSFQPLKDELFPIRAFRMNAADRTIPPIVTLQLSHRSMGSQTGHMVQSCRRADEAVGFDRLPGRFSPVDDAGPFERQTPSGILEG